MHVYISIENGSLSLFLAEKFAKLSKYRHGLISPQAKHQIDTTRDNARKQRIDVLIFQYLLKNGYGDAERTRMYCEGRSFAVATGTGTE
jgi:hypothetical protein